MVLQVPGLEFQAWFKRQFRHELNKLDFSHISKFYALKYDETRRFKI